VKLSEDVRRDLLARLTRVEGQARGVQRMVEENRECGDIVQQISAMRAALAKVAATVVAENLEECLRRGAGGAGEDDVRRAKQAILNLL
jgi:DNA-binding FrmR family transcriptional regulator